MSSKYNLQRDSADDRDLVYFKHLGLFRYIPKKFDLFPRGPEAYAHSQLHTCTSSAVAFCIEYVEKKQQQRAALLSRLFYYDQPEVEQHFHNHHLGSGIRDEIKSVIRHGLPQETSNIHRSMSSKPQANISVSGEARPHYSGTYRRIPKVPDAVAHCLSVNHRPILIGLTIRESLESTRVAHSGIYSPGVKERILGAHTAVIVGYDYYAGTVTIRYDNGDQWGLHGHFKIPAHILFRNNEMGDLWSIESATPE